MINSSFLVILIFFIATAGLLGLFVATGPTINQAGSSQLYFNVTSTVQVNNSANYQVGLIGSTQTGANSTNLTCAIDSLPFPENFEVMLGLKSLSSFCSTSGNQLGEYNLLTSKFGAFGLGSNVGTTGENSLSGLLEVCLAIMVAFIALGLLAGTLGAGSFANIVSVSGIGIAIIYFFGSVLSSTIFTGTPSWIMDLLLGIIGGVYIWMVVMLLK